MLPLPRRYRDEFLKICRRRAAMDISGVKRAEDIAILRPFDMKVLQVRPSPAQDAELKRLGELDRKTKRECASCTF